MEPATLLEVLRDQKKELGNYANRHFCKRAEEGKIRLDSSKAQVVIGVRRSGKSTLCYNALKKSNVNFAYANFDDERLAKLSSDELNDVLKSLYQIYGDFTHLFLDEIQNIDGWHLFVNRILRHGIHVIITGSNAKLLSSELSTHLTGRYNEIRLFPFSFTDYCRFKHVDMTDDSTKGDALLRKAFDEYQNSGGFPEIVNGEEDASVYIDILVGNILNRDIIQRFKVRYKDAFCKLANHLMNNAPCEVVNTLLQEQFGFKNSHTVENYVGYLYQAYLLLQLKKYSNKSIERIRNAKCYTVDVALMNARKDTLARENLGWRLENTVFIELNRRYGSGYDIYFYNSGSFEADFVLCHRATAIEVIQVSYDIENPKTFNREINGLLRTSEATQCNQLTLITAYTEKNIEKDGKLIKVIPCYKWLTQQ